MFTRLPIHAAIASPGTVPATRKADDTANATIRECGPGARCSGAVHVGRVGRAI